MKQNKSPMTLFLSHPWLTKISLMLVGLFALLMILFVRHPVASELCINEVYATRGSESDWIELYNAGLNTRSLKGLYLTDDSRELTKFQIKEDLLILPKSFLVIYGEGHNDESGALTVSFGVGNGRNHLPDSERWADGSRFAHRGERR